MFNLIDLMFEFNRKGHMGRCRWPEIFKQSICWK